MKGSKFLTADLLPDFQSHRSIACLISPSEWPKGISNQAEPDRSTGFSSNPPNLFLPYSPPSSKHYYYSPLCQSQNARSYAGFLSHLPPTSNPTARTVSFTSRIYPDSFHSPISTAAPLSKPSKSVI